MRYLFLTLIFISGCANNEPQFEGEPLFDKDELHCPKNTIKYCTGRFKKDMECSCVPKTMLYW